MCVKCWISYNRSIIPKPTKIFRFVVGSNKYTDICKIIERLFTACVLFLVSGRVWFERGLVNLNWMFQPCMILLQNGQYAFLNLQ